MVAKSQEKSPAVKTNRPANFVAKLEAGKAEFPEDVPATIRVIAALEKTSSHDAAAIVLLRTLLADLTEVSPALHNAVGAALDEHMVTLSETFGKCSEMFTALRRATRGNAKAPAAPILSGASGR